jgi:uncharacterized protein YdeI (YjbR/CyaY-like superfamily)
MGKRDKRVDAYIATAPAFAQPILERIRESMHEYCPGVEETMKWSRPHFMHGGAMLCGMSAFKEHASLGFWKGEEVTGKPVEEGAGQFGRLIKVADLPSKADLKRYVKRAMELNGAPARVARTTKRAAKPPLVIPPVFMAAIKKNKQALAGYNDFSPSHQREYIEWIVDAKSDETRNRRIEQAVAWMAEGKSRNWKYQ